MINSKCTVYFPAAKHTGVIHYSTFAGIAAYRRKRRNCRRFFGRGQGSQKAGSDPDGGSCQDTGNTEPEYRHVCKIFRAQSPQQSAEPPDYQNTHGRSGRYRLFAIGQPFLNHKPFDLFTGSSQAAQHAKKTNPFRNTCLKAAADHQNGGNQYKKEKDNGCTIHGQEVRIPALPHSRQQIDIILYLLL